jgi:PleD family two-component response regulator
MALEQLLNQVDQALYQAKLAGRDRINIYSPTGEKK